jgi:hypothetical protein
VRKNIDLGGLVDCEVENMALLGKCLVKLLTIDGVLLTPPPPHKRKYVGSKALYRVYWKPRDSYFLGWPNDYK